MNDESFWLVVKGFPLIYTVRIRMLHKSVVFRQPLPYTADTFQPSVLIRSGTMKQRPV